MLVNGSPTQEFWPSKGLRQGDLLAPFLFLIVVEGLAGLVRVAAKKKLLEGIKVGEKNIEVNMLQFTNDTLFLSEAKTQNIMVIKSILRCFELAAGLKVNFIKSKIGGVGVTKNYLQRFSKMLNCDTMQLPFSYLGMPIGDNPKKHYMWKDVVEKIRKKLAKWKEKHLSFTGRTCLLKYVITSLPLFFLSFFKIPKYVEKEIKRIQRDFLCGCGCEGRKIAWVKWDNICKPKELGGLGVKSLRLFNIALLGKGKWRMGIECERLWKSILDSKYGSWRSLDNKIDNKLN